MRMAYARISNAVSLLENCLKKTSFLRPFFLLPLLGLSFAIKFFNLHGSLSKKRERTFTNFVPKY